MNLRWSWDERTRDLFRWVDPEAWDANQHDPVRLLATVEPERLQALAADSAVFDSTVLFLDYDENDGFFDHVPPPVPPAGTADEFILNGTPIGLGYRVPMIIASPWTRGGRGAMGWLRCLPNRENGRPRRRRCRRGSGVRAHVSRGTRSASGHRPCS